MAGFVRGDVVVVVFPFSDLSNAKRRPAVVLAPVGVSDFLLCQVTSKATEDPLAVSIGSTDFESGGLKHPSCARPARLFTAEQSVILYRAAHLTESKLEEIVDSIVNLLRG